MNLRILISLIIIVINVIIRDESVSLIEDKNSYSVEKHLINNQNLATKRLQRTDLKDFVNFYHDDFNGTKLNTKMWSYFREGDTVFNSIYNRNNVKLNDGKLFLITDSIGTGLYTAANISTEMNKLFHSKYGYFEIRAKQPKNYGNGSAFWIITSSATKEFQQPNPALNGTEIDIFEYSPTQKDRIFYSLHWNGYGKNSFSLHQTDSLLWKSKDVNAFHTYALKWTPKEYVIYVDDEEQARSTQAVSRIEEFVILGCGTGGYAGNPFNARGSWPDTFTVDYIKVYNLKPMVFLNGDCGYRGWLSDGLIPGNYNTALLQTKGFVNNQLSAIEIPKGWSVTLFDGDHFTGDSLVLKHSISCIDKDANDRVSSIKIKSNDLSVN